LAGRIDYLESIPRLLKSLQIQALANRLSSVAVLNGLSLFSLAFTLQIFLFFLGFVVRNKTGTFSIISLRYFRNSYMEVLSKVRIIKELLLCAQTTEYF
jgi:hypothetical protein